MQAAVTSLERGAGALLIAAVHGACIGGGVMIYGLRHPPVCGGRPLRRARDAAGHGGHLGTLQRLPALVGQGIARELVFSGRDFDAAYAERIGLVNRVLPDADAFAAAARALAREIADNPPLAGRAPSKCSTRRNAASTGVWNTWPRWNVAHLLLQDSASP
jgi:enoyl-CoA hydratase